MIPALKNKTIRRSVSNPSNRSDLTLKIVKTADNNLSIVKKGMNEPISLPSTPNTPHLDENRKFVDLTRDDSPVMTAAGKRSLERRKSVMKGKINKSLEVVTLPSSIDSDTNSKPIKALRRKSFVFDKIEPKKISAVTMKRKSVHARCINDLTDSQAPVPPSKRGRPSSKSAATPENAKTNSNTSKAQTTAEKNEQSMPNAVAKNDISTDNSKTHRKRKSSKSPDLNDSKNLTETKLKSPDVKKSAENVDAKTEAENSRGILESVGLSRVTSKEAKKTNSGNQVTPKAADDVIDISDDETWLQFDKKSQNLNKKEAPKSNAKPDQENSKIVLQTKTNANEAQTKEPG